MVAFNRRKFLAAGAAAGAAVLTGGVPGAAAEAEIDFEGLRRAMTGQLVRPGEAGYEAAARPWNLALPQRRPAAVAKVANRADVIACVQRAGGRGVPLVARSGGHSYAGYSTPDEGVVVDVSALNTVQVRADGTAVIGSGARLIDVYSALAASGRALPGGTCSTVGIAGLTLGGGIGVFTRPFGLTCDHLQAATVVTADGATHTVTGNRDADLLWALRGGGGGHAGIVTDFTFTTVPAPRPVTLELAFPAERTATVLAAWHAWQHSAPDGLTTVCSIGGGAAPNNRISGTWLGTVAALEARIGELVVAVGANPTTRQVVERDYLAAMRHYAGCEAGSIQSCQLEPVGSVPRESFRAGSRMLTQPVTPTSAERILAAVRPQRDLVLLFDALGGRAGRVGAADTAYPHRNAFASVQVYSWNGANGPGVTQVQQALAPVVGNGSYVNYVNPEQTDWAGSYWGANRARLRGTVASYDPNGVFDFPHSVLRA
ncbi:hypothetical protein JOF53_000840 [Crossiella equi]|uniref:FAD-binding PCMH-type domain-containing protein n=1 Tax=Crossiella equi TaxID=130796 RepID=A0ABS5A5U4_9PSEU|nr:FAD-dependent oxidoreductase [Crossiella equi]MBP2471968.1 hypothetical protein [Crossiella equi]